jgi:hypothetical protein
MIEDYEIKNITKNNLLWKSWLLKKHYAHRIPIVLECFGLYIKNDLIGICTFSPPPRMLNEGFGCFNTLELKGFELSRLCIIENHKKNILSFFVSHCLDEMKIKYAPCFIVSYADSNMNHHGYIYQSTNWIYTGMTNPEKVYKLKSGKVIHGRTLGQRTGSRAEKNINEEIEVIKTNGKYRYFYFLGSSRECKRMKKDFNYPILEYPKGENKRYDASYEPQDLRLLK